MKSKLLLILLLFSVPLFSEDIYQRIQETEKNINISYSKKGDLEKESKEIQEKIKEVIKKEKGYTALRDRTERELYKIEKEKNIIEKNVERIKKDIIKTEYEIGELNVSQKQQEQALTRRVVALYKLGKYGYVDILLSSEDILDFESRIKYLMLISEADAKLIQNIIIARDKKEETKILQKQNFDKLKIEFSKKIDCENKMKSKTNELKTIVNNLKDNKKLLEIRNREIQESLDNLNKTIENLLKKRKLLEEEELALKREFDAKRGNLIWPCDRNKIIGYQFNPYENSKGIKITIPEGCNVYAVSPGKVVYADWMKGFGRLILIDHGGGYYTLYGHLSSIDIEVDKEVKTKDVIGKTGQTGSDEGPVLYFEIKYTNKSVEVKKWLK
ncbi:MAG: peptidoglycan DD-metalloendopeptidase family protein [Candidatus Hydrogenedentota bacterium]